MKKYLYLISFILISAAFSGCFNERSVSSADNQTEGSSVVSENNIDNNTAVYIDEDINEDESISNENDTTDSINDFKEVENSIVIDNATISSFSNISNSSIQKPKLHNLDNKSHISSSHLGSNLEDKITDLQISDSSLRNSSLTGTYKIIFFGSQVINVDNAIFGSVADMYYVSNDCKKAQKLYPDIINIGVKNKCSLITQSKILDGVVIIYYDENNKINIISRLQMEGGIIENSPADKYQYTVYYPMKDSVLLQGKGITNWNYNLLTKSPANVSTTFNKSPFKLSILDDGLIRIDMTLIDKMIKAVGKNMTIDAKNTIILEKVSSDYERLENKVQKKFSR